MIWPEGERKGKKERREEERDRNGRGKEQVTETGEKSES